MASFKPTKIQVYPKLGEKVTQDTLYWKNYKVRFLRLLFLAYLEPVVLYHYHCLMNMFLVPFTVFSQPPLQIKEFGAITSIDFSPVAPHNFAVTAFSRVGGFFFFKYSFVILFFTVHSTKHLCLLLSLKKFSPSDPHL